MPHIGSGCCRESNINFKANFEPLMATFDSHTVLEVKVFLFHSISTTNFVLFSFIWNSQSKSADDLYVNRCNHCQQTNSLANFEFQFDSPSLSRHTIKSLHNVASLDVDTSSLRFFRSFFSIHHSLSYLLECVGEDESTLFFFYYTSNSYRNLWYSSDDVHRARIEESCKKYFRCLFPCWLAWQPEQEINKAQ